MFSFQSFSERESPFPDRKNPFQEGIAVRPFILSSKIIMQKKVLACHFKGLTFNRSFSFDFFSKKPRGLILIPIRRPKLFI